MSCCTMTIENYITHYYIIDKTLIDDVFDLKTKYIGNKIKIVFAWELTRQQI